MRVIRFCPIGPRVIYSLNFNKILFSNPIYFNDPFECLFGANHISMNDLTPLVEYFKNDENKIRISHFIPRVYPYQGAQIALNNLIWNPTHIYNNLSCLHLLINILTIEKTNIFCGSYKDKFFDEQSQTFQPASVIMSSNYGANHSGLIIEYDYSLYQDQENIVTVNYDKDIEPLGVNTSVLNKILSGHTKSFFTNKHLAWSYESEIRLFSAQNENTFDLDNTPLKNLYFLEYCQQEYIDLITDIICKKYNGKVGLFKLKKNNLYGYTTTSLT